MTSLDGTEGVITADSGDEYSFRAKDLPEGGGVAARVKFSPAPPGKGSAKDGKKEVKFKSISVLMAAPSEPAPEGEANSEAQPAPEGDTSAEVPSQHEPPAVTPAAPGCSGDKQGKESVI